MRYFGVAEPGVEQLAEDVAFLLAAAFPQCRLWVVSAANAVLSLNALMWYRVKCQIAQSSSDAARS